MTTSAEGFLYLLRAEPSLLPAAPADATAAMMEHRRNDEVHPCLRCGGRARRAYVARHPVAGPLWLDLCAPCDHWLRSGLAEGWPVTVVRDPTTP